MQTLQRFPSTPCVSLDKLPPWQSLRAAALFIQAIPWIAAGEGFHSEAGMERMPEFCANAEDSAAVGRILDAIGCELEKVALVLAEAGESGV